MNKKKIYNIFISHAWKYTEHYKQIVKWLDEAEKEGEFFWKNYSVPEHDPKINPNEEDGKAILKEALKKQIKPASIILILSGMYTNYSDWIKFEIKTADELKKHIIGIKPWGQKKIPSEISRNADNLVGWNKKSIIEEIKKY